MATTTSKLQSSGRSRDPLRDAVVLAAMTVVALALGIGLNLQLGMVFGLAVLAALSAYAALVTAHLLIRRHENVDTLRREVARLEGQLARKPAQTVSSAGATQEPQQHASTDLIDDALKAIRPAGPIAPVNNASLDDYWKFRPAVPVQPATEPLPQTSEPATERRGLMQEATPDWSGIESAAWASMPASTGREVSPAAAAANAPPQVPTSPREADLEKINILIRKLAADINAGQGNIDKLPTDGQADVAQRTGLAAVDAVAIKQALVSEAPLRPASGVDASIDALQSVADVMRAAGQASTAVRGSAAVSIAGGAVGNGNGYLPPPIPEKRADPRLSALAEALRQDRFEVMLEPILALGDLRARHFEVSVRLKSDAGAPTGELGTNNVARGSGLLPLLDAMKVERSARIAWRMEDRGKQGSLFSEMSGESLVSDRFLDRFADTYRQRGTLSGRLVLSFLQADLRTFSDLQWATLGDMQELGFRFCLEQITDLDLDFQTLAASGFAFVKLDAPVFLRGLAIANGAAESAVIPPADICRHFEHLGLAIIVGHITDERQSAELKACGVALGQGALFGGPRPVKADVLQYPQTAVA